MSYGIVLFLLDSQHGSWRNRWCHYDSLQPSVQQLLQGFSVWENKKKGGDDPKRVYVLEKRERQNTIESNKDKDSSSDTSKKTQWEGTRIGSCINCWLHNSIQCMNYIFSFVYVIYLILKYLHTQKMHYNVRCKGDLYLKEVSRSTTLINACFLRV